MHVADGELVSRVIESIASPTCAQVCFRKMVLWVERQIVQSRASGDKTSPRPSIGHIVP